MRNTKKSHAQYIQEVVLDRQKTIIEWNEMMKRKKYKDEIENVVSLMIRLNRLDAILLKHNMEIPK